MLLEVWLPKIRFRMENVIVAKDVIILEFFPEAGVKIWYVASAFFDFDTCYFLFNYIHDDASRRYYMQ